jgi:IrrE N-terminal-like domain
MSDELMMDLADCGSPEKLIAVILKHYPAWTAPVPIEEFAKTVNIVELRELDSDRFEGALLTDANKTKGVILIRAGARKERRRFTIADELGHFLMPSHKGNQQCTAADLRLMWLMFGSSRSNTAPVWRLRVIGIVSLRMTSAPSYSQKMESFAMCAPLPISRACL